MADDDEIKTKYDNDDLADDDLNSMQDVRLDPETLFTNTLFKMQAALIKDDLKAGLLQFRLLSEHAEMIAKAMGRLDDVYTQSLEDYKNSDEYKNSEGDDLIKSTKLAQKKAELLLTSYLKYRTTTAPLKI